MLATSSGLERIQGQGRRFQNAGAHPTSPTYLFPREKGQGKQLPISWMSGVTGASAESSKGSQGTLSAHLQWEQGDLCCRMSGLKQTGRVSSPQ